jgi:hypothetical protein
MFGYMHTLQKDSTTNMYITFPNYHFSFSKNIKIYYFSNSEVHHALLLNMITMQSNGSLKLISPV